MSKTIVLSVHNLHYSYSKNSQTVDEIHVLKGIDFNLHARQKIALVGASGVGKSTFLHLLGMLDQPQKGHIEVCSGGEMVNTAHLSDKKRAYLRGALFGFVYQFHHLLPEFTALENIIIPQLILGKSFSNAKDYAQELLHLVGLQDRMNHRPSQLSGGQQQRTAIARALANKPSILLADEPTGNLDEKTAHDIFQLFLTLTRTQKLSIVMATHNPMLFQYFDSIFSLCDGHLHPEVKE